MSLGVELSTVPLVTLVQEEEEMKRNSNSNIMKNVKGEIVALLGGTWLVDSTSSEAQA